MRSASPTDRQHEAQKISLEEMYKHTLKVNDQWGIDLYRTPKKYQTYQKDTLGKIGNFQQNFKKIRQNKKGNFDNQLLKEASQIPSPAHYNLIKVWFKENKDQQLQQKLIIKPPKQTFIDNIIKYEEKNQKPGPGKYNDYISQFKPGYKQDIIDGNTTQFTKKDRSLPNLHRDNYLDEVLFLAQETPGPGDYNPHDNIVRVKVNKHDHKYWITKHRSPSPIKNPQIKPGVWTYSPLSQTFSTFDTIAQNQKQGKNRPVTRSKSPDDIKFVHYGFGADIRFKDPFKSTKSKMVLKVPGPGTHNTVPHWPGKKDPVNGKQCNRNFYKFITTKPPEISMYVEKSQNEKQTQQEFYKPEIVKDQQ